MARTLEVVSRTRGLVSAKRQKNQLELAFGAAAPPQAAGRLGTPAAKGEARSSATEGTEAGAASFRPESPAAPRPSPDGRSFGRRIDRLLTVDGAIAGGDCRTRQSAEGALAGLLTGGPSGIGSMASWPSMAQVRRDKGAPGVDGMTVNDLSLYLMDHWPAIRCRLLDGTYKPQPVLRVEIPEVGGGTRAHRPSADGRSDSRSERGQQAAEGHPDGARPLPPAGGAALWRLLTPAIAWTDRSLLRSMVLQVDWDPTLSAASYGFRPGRSAHQAVTRAQEYIAAG